MQLLSRGLMAVLALSCGTMAPWVWGVQDAPPRQVHARSQQEAADYHADYSVSGGAALEQAAASFAQKYPGS